MRAEIAQHPGSAHFLTQPPDSRAGGIQEPSLVVAGDDVVDLADFTRLYDLANKRGRGYVPVRKIYRGLNARFSRGGCHRSCLVPIHRQWLFAQNVDTTLDGGKANLCVRDVRG